MGGTIEGQIARRAGDLVTQGYHWSEATVLAVGEHLWGCVDDRIVRMTSGLGGGIGGSYEELCGVMSGGTLIIGGLYGRTRVDEDDSECNRLVCAFRDRFIERFGTTRCFDLRESGYGGDGLWPCSLLVERATRILLEVLAGGGS